MNIIVGSQSTQENSSPGRLYILKNMKMKLQQEKERDIINQQEEEGR